MFHIILTKKYKFNMIDFKKKDPFYLQVHYYLLH